ncbi:MAG: T9SS type A sorting domain-containing protein [Flavobacteriales bacterium]|jgi:hypothetical protein|nr:T9SS type A sorting domain-containing protein [Flavobacteriales bacterium]
MKRILTILFVMTSLVGIGQDTIFFNKIGTKYSERGIRMEPIANGEFLILVNSGYSASEASSNVDLVRIDWDGNVKHSTSIGSEASESALDFAIASDSTIIISGISNGLQTGYNGFLYFVRNDSLIKEINVSGEAAWNAYDDLTVSDDTVFVVHDFIDDPSSTPVIEKYSIQGDFFERLVLTDLPGYKFESISREKYGSGFLATGSVLGDSLDGFIIRFNRNFSVEWEYVLGLSGDETYVDLVETNDSSIIAIGNSSSFNGPDFDILVQKFTSLGVSMDTIIQGYGMNVNNGDDLPTDIAIDEDTVYITGHTNTFGLGKSDGFITLMTINLGPKQFSTTFGTKSTDESFQIIKTTKGLCGIGSTDNKTNGLDDIVYWRREVFSNDTTVIADTAYAYDHNPLLLTVESSNAPVSDELRVYYSTDFGLHVNNGEAEVEYELFDVSGQSVYSNRGNSRGRIGSLPTGVYIIRIASGQFTTSQKVFIH